jgi:hypothetical protein
VQVLPPYKFLVDRKRYVATGRSLLVTTGFVVERELGMILTHPVDVVTTVCSATR